MSYLANNQGAITGTLGNQELGRITISQSGPPSGYTTVVSDLTNARHNGDFDGKKLIDLNSISGQYDERFDDPTYYS